MQLTEGQTVDTTGTIRNRLVGRGHARATLVMEDDGQHLPIVWWNPGSAPPDGARVRIRGRLRTFKGKIELHADETKVDRTGDADGSLSSIAAFYLACVEAEAASSLRLRPGGKEHIVLLDTPSPLHATLSFTEASPHRGWFQARETTIGEVLLTGWPLVIGNDPDTGRGGLILSPLLIADAELDTSDGAWQLRTQGTGPDLNPFALSLLGLDREARDELVATVESSMAVDESATSAERTSAILGALQDEDIDGLEELDPESLLSVPNGRGIHNAGIVMTASASARIIHSLVEDLEQIANYPEMLATGPAAVFLGQASSSDVPLTEPHPTIVHSSLHQDQAIHSAMVNDFTVVTGPPGTGKSQVLVNVVAAAVAQRNTVLFASKNNRAVDVVVDRLRSSSPSSIVVRAGASGQRNQIADYIQSARSAPARNVDSGSTRKAWITVEKSLLLLYRHLHERHRLEAELDDQETRLKAILEGLPSGIDTEVDLPQLDAALADACRALDAFGDRLWWFRRWRRHHRRLTHARQALRRISDILGTDHAEIEACLTAVADKPTRTLTPRHVFRSVEQIIKNLQDSAGHGRRIEEIRTRLSALPRKHELDDRLHELHKARLEASIRLLDARWNEIRDESSEAHNEALQLADCLERMSSGARGVRKQAFMTLPKALPALPVWAVTNMSARTNLPLIPGLFDLVVIDEASQCDIASALPLLVRGKRALIIGDQKQLIHIASLSRGREQAIARKSGLTDDQAGEFSYTSRSCFSLAASRISAGPVFLDLHFRSHPAIIGFSNERFYGRRLELCSAATPPENLRAVQWIRVLGESERGPDGRSRVNVAEAQRIVQAIVRGLPTYKKNECDVGIVTPYVAQARLIETLLGNVLDPVEHTALKIATAHRFQGDERDIMYFSPVIDRSLSAPEVRFAANPNLINVALTRARRRLVVVGDPDACLAHDNALRDLTVYALRLQASGFHSPLELDLCDALRKEGIVAQPGVVVGGYRLGLAVEQDGFRLDIECDGAAFHAGKDEDAARDHAVRSEGWSVMRFSGRALSRDLDACVKAVVDRIPAP